MVNIEENTLKHSISAYPNPTNQTLFINLGMTYQQINLKIRDITGKLVFVQSYSQQDLLKLNISSFLPGIYFINVDTEQGHSLLRVIKNE